MRVSLRCLLTGHDDLIRRQAGRMFLECFECGRETPGWSIGRREQRSASPAAPRAAAAATWRVWAH